MKKNIIFIAFLLIFLLPMIHLNADENVDFIVLLDSSQSMFSYYNEVTEYLISSLVQQYIRFDDTFHLVSFSDTTQIEIIQTIKTENDIKSILSRLYLLYPLGKNTDILTALRNLQQYVYDLPSSSTKFIVLITDGVHAPSSNSPFINFSSGDVKAEIKKIATKINEQGWIFKIVSVPFQNSETNTEVSFTNSKENSDVSPPLGSGNYLEDLSSSLNVGITEFTHGNTITAVNDTIKLPSATYPKDLGKIDYRFKFPIIIKNPSSTEVLLEFTAIIVNSTTNILEKKQVIAIKPLTEDTINLNLRLPDSWQTGKSTVTVEPVLSGGVRIIPGKTSILLELKHSPIKGFLISLSSNFVRVTLILIAILTAFLVIKYINSIHKKADSPIVDVVLAKSADINQQDSKTENNNSINKNKLPSSHPAIFNNDATFNKNISEDQNNQTRTANLVNNFTTPLSNPNKLFPKFNNNSNLQKKSEINSLPKTETLPDLIFYEPKILKPGTIQVEFKVEGQNRNIGARNIRTLHAGGRKLLGSGISCDFLIFLLPFPRKLAEIHYDGESIIIVPKQLDIFPEFSNSKAIKLGEKIRIINHNNRELLISFDRYVSPLEKVNKLLHCIDSPGL